MNILNRLKIKAKLAILLAISALSLVAATVLASHFLYEKMMEERLGKLRGIVETAHGIAQQLEGEVAAGRMKREEAIERFRNNVQAMWYDDRQNYLIAFTMEGISVAHAADPKQVGSNRIGIKDSNGKPIVGSMIEALKTQNEGTITYYYPKPGEKEPLPKLTFMKKFEPWNAFIATGVYTDDIDEEFRSVVIGLGLAVLLLIAVAGGLAILINRNITLSLAALQRKMERLAAGDTAIDVEEATRRDEIGDMARAVQVFKENALEMQRLQAEQEQLKEEAEQEKKRALATLADTFETRIRGIVDVLSHAATGMQSTARSMSTTAERTREQSLAVASGANQATANVQTVAAASEELSASIAEIGRQVLQASVIARKAAEEGDRTNVTVSALAEAAQKIDEIIALINDIAGQTNLLALNATIEAARAGEAGKGFAVVASEVKSLANQTAKATEDIRSQIAAIQVETRSAVDAIQGISKVILELNDISSSIAAAVEEQTAATQEITRNVQEAANGTQDVSRNIAGVSEAVEKAGTSASEVLGAADGLAEQADTLRVEVDGFLATIRKAA